MTCSTAKDSRSSRRALLAVTFLAVATRLAATVGTVDVDADAYGHFIVGRRLLENPTDLSVHWVWLPLWHVVHALSDRVGLGFDGVRALSWLASCATVPALFVFVERECSGLRAPRLEAQEACLAATFAALTVACAPRAIASATSAEPEAVFALLLLLGVDASRRGRAILAGAVFSLAALLRYEAWPFLAAVWLVARTQHTASVAARWTWMLPAFTVLLWCVVHRVSSGQWLWFIRENQRFVARTLPELVPALPSIERRALWYPVTIPWLEWGAAWVSVIFVGFAQTIRARMVAVVAPAAVLVGFVSFAWVRGQHLGLMRHAVAYMPFYGAAAGVGVLKLLHLARRRGRSAYGPADPSAHEFNERSALPLHPVLRSTIALAAIALSLRALGGARAHRALAASAMSDERSVASTLAARVRGSDAVFCDIASVEALSNLHRSRFIRWRVTDVRPYNLRVECERRRAAVWIVSAPERARHLADVELVLFTPRVVLLRYARP